MAKKKHGGKNKKKTTDEEAKLFSILTYPLFIVGLIWYIIDDDLQKRTFAKYHFKQSLILALAYIVVSIAAGILWFIPYLGLTLSRLAGLAYLILAIIGLINAANGEKKQLPFIGRYAEKLKF